MQKEKYHESKKNMNHAYILQCHDGTLYTGSTKNLTKRIQEHNGRKSGAKYTRARRPVTLVYKEEYEALSDARKRENEIKRMERQEKLLLIQSSDLSP